MTQPPENTGGQPDGEQTVGSAAQAPPPGSWYFPPEQGGPPPYVPPPQYGTPQQYGAPPQYGAPQPYGAAPQQPQGSPSPAYPGGPGYRAGPEPDLAGRWRRLFARVIDGLVISIVLVPLSIPLLRRSLDNLQRVSNRYPNLHVPGARAAISRADGRFFGAFLIFGALAAVILFLYDWSQHAKWGQTLGKRALHTRVVTAHGRSPINGTIAAKRSAVYALVPAIPVLGGLFALLNELWLLWDPRRQCLHDKAARTIVIRTDLPGGPPPPQW